MGNFSLNLECCLLLKLLKRVPVQRIDPPIEGMIKSLLNYILTSLEQALACVFPLQEMVIKRAHEMRGYLILQDPIGGKNTRDAC